MAERLISWLLLYRGDFLHLEHLLVVSWGLDGRLGCLDKGVLGARVVQLDGLFLSCLPFRPLPSSLDLLWTHIKFLIFLLQRRFPF
mmetsp:Transcript_24317/g.23936  ORF Transcript_24317/g.23936 Transcript_24317/m.23936 type:complete len:86 (-) Transcript_24317:7-264(-)